MLKSLDENGDVNWTSAVRELLFQYGLSYAWLNQDVGNKELFINTFKQRCKDIYYQEWSSSVTSSKYLSTYSTFKQDLISETYLQLLPFRHLRRALTKFRCSVAGLNIQLYRRSKGDDISISMCAHCLNKVEDEYHVLLECPKYTHIRTRYLPYYYYTYPNRQKFVTLMMSESPNIILRLAVYCSKTIRN